MEPIAFVMGRKMLLGIKQRAEKKTPGFEIVFAIAGLLAVAYLLRRRE
ncbi:MAG: PGF-CTERM sorting domain-containing protein [Methanophagales archaeon]|jgi:PGF-CTERM protein|nr:PGF-CTERM sorting domain-containing protein [Methanophagales archaeon]